MGGAIVLGALGAGGASAQQSEPALKETHGAWEVRCVAENDCFIEQYFRDEAKDKAMVFRLRKSKSSGGGAGSSDAVEAEIVFPIGYYLPNGITMQVDAEDTHRFSFKRCIPSSCATQEVFSMAMVDDLKGGRVAKFTAYRTSKQRVDIDLSLIGFTAAYNAL